MIWWITASRSLVRLGTSYLDCDFPQSAVTLNLFVCRLLHKRYSSSISTRFSGGKEHLHCCVLLDRVSHHQDSFCCVIHSVVELFVRKKGRSPAQKMHCHRAQKNCSWRGRLHTTRMSLFIAPAGRYHLETWLPAKTPIVALSGFTLLA